MINSEARDTAARAERIVWRRSFDDQLTPATMLVVLRFAAARARPLVRGGLLDQENAAEELLNEAIAATLAGAATWDPTRKALENHLIDVIQWQTRNTRRRHGRVRYASFDDSRDDTSSDGRRLENEATLQRAPEPAASADLCGAADRVLEEVRGLVKGDTDVVRIIDTIGAGHTDHGDLIRASGLRAAKFRNARRRLGRIISRLPVATRAAAQAVLQ